MTPKSYPSAWLGLTLAAAVVALPVAAHALDAKKPDAVKAAPEKPAASPEHKTDQKPEGPAVLSEVQRQFCMNNAATANDERLAWQVGKIAALESSIKQRIGELEAKRAEYVEWLKKRDEAMKNAEEGVVAIYAKMRPDAAASQLAAMDDVMASAVLSKLNPRTASAILAEMEPGRAARLTSAMVGPPPSPDKKKS